MLLAPGSNDRLLVIIVSDTDIVGGSCGCGDGGRCVTVVMATRQECNKYSAESPKYHYKVSDLRKTQYRSHH